MKQLYLILLISVLSILSCSPEVKTISRVPAWAKEAVWYQIFPERFNNGDKANDPNIHDVTNIWPFIEPEGWQVHPWTSDWYKLQPWEENLDYDFYQIQGLRRYGGDIQGIIDKLDYLKKLGINSIYLNPIFEAPSLHKYDATMYRHIDNNFGPNPEEDIRLWSGEIPDDPSTWKWTTADKLFLELIRECHKKDIKIIIDGVFNHVGIQFWAFKDVVKNQQNSKFADWFTVNTWDDPATEENEFDYEGWIGIKDLPEFKENEKGLISPIKQHVFNIVKRWMDPNNDGDPSDGIDGWRLDVAEMVSLNFWKDFRKVVKDINPDAYITGEVWWEDWQHNEMFNASRWLQGDAFDAVMNYRFARSIRHFIMRKDSSITSQGFIDSLNNIYNDYDKENLYVCMNLMDSHDVDRLASQILNPDNWYDHYANPAQDKNYNVEAPGETAIEKQKLIIGLQMSLPGAPMIYYGDEAGMWGGDDPDCRKPMVWPDLTYDDETNHPFGKPRHPDEVKFNDNLFTWYKNLISIRKNNTTLSLGDVKFKPITDKILLITRSYNDNTIYIIVNNSGENYSLKVFPDLLPVDDYTDLITNDNSLNTEKKTILLTPYQIRIIKGS